MTADANMDVTEMLNYLTTILRQPSYILEINEKKEKILAKKEKI